MADYLILAPIALLLLVGAFIALRSGADALSAPGSEADAAGLRLVAGNLSALLLRVVGWFALFAVLQGFVGFPALLAW